MSHDELDVKEWVLMLFYLGVRLPCGKPVTVHVSLGNSVELYHRRKVPSGTQ